MSFNLTAEINRLILEEDERQTEEGLKYLGRSNKKIMLRVMTPTNCLQSWIFPDEKNKPECLGGTRLLAWCFYHAGSYRI
mgnify:CR=1 FL=1